MKITKFFNTFRKKGQTLQEEIANEQTTTPNADSGPKEESTQDGSFETYFSELQADMVSICLENVEDRADMIYIYCSFESNVLASSYFYKINGKVVSRAKLNDAVGPDEPQYDVSVARQKEVMNIINDDIRKIRQICMDYDRPMPTEMKIIYDVKKNSLNTDYKYENVYSSSKTKTAYDIAEEWFEEMKRK
ncbi:MAG: hypothetical protein J1F42_05165 [Lachnospiraceae bacterium]|nr:hypothetical protein [Lachnospiraceae bacterium]